MVVKYGFTRSATKFPATSLRSLDQTIYVMKLFFSICLMVNETLHTSMTKLFSLFFLKNLGGTDYYCPTCKAKFNFELSDSEKGQPRVKYVCGAPFNVF